MKKFIINFFLILGMLLTLSCGFKVLNKSQMNDFIIKEVKSSGDKRINFKIKNNLLINDSDDSNNSLIINLNTKKIKSIKEKNIKNEITKYQITLEANVQLHLLKTGKKTQIKLTSSGDYLVAKNYSTTINNEKKLIENLVENLSEKISDEINSNFNDI